MNVRYMANTAIEEGFFCRITKLQKCHSRYEASEVFLNFFLIFCVHKSLTPKWCVSNEGKKPHYLQQNCFIFGAQRTRPNTLNSGCERESTPGRGVSFILMANHFLSRPSRWDGTD